MLQAEKAAVKKLENVKIGKQSTTEIAVLAWQILDNPRIIHIRQLSCLDHQKRLENLQRAQDSNLAIGQLIEMNLELGRISYAS